MQLPAPLGRAHRLIPPPSCSSCFPFPPLFPLAPSLPVQPLAMPPGQDGDSASLAHADVTTMTSSLSPEQGRPAQSHVEQSAPAGQPAASDAITGDDSLAQESAPPSVASRSASVNCAPREGSGNVLLQGAEGKEGRRGKGGGALERWRKAVAAHGERGKGGLDLSSFLEDNGNVEEVDVHGLKLVCSIANGRDAMGMESSQKVLASHNGQPILLRPYQRVLRVSAPGQMKLSLHIKTC